jgi:hypothetical protein
MIGEGSRYRAAPWMRAVLDARHRNRSSDGFMRWLPSMRAIDLGLTLLASVVGSCKQNGSPIVVDDPAVRALDVDSAEQAIAGARECVTREPRRFRSVWGTPLVFGQASVTRWGGNWIVSIPESGESPSGQSVGLGAPQGRDLVVMADRRCVPAPMD